MLMVHPSTPHDAPPQRRTSQRGKAKKQHHRRVGGGPPSYQMWGPTDNEKTNKMIQTLEFRPGQKYIYIYTSRQVSYKTLISRYSLGEPGPAPGSSPTHLTCLSLSRSGAGAGKSRRIQFVCASSSSRPSRHY